MTLSGGAIEQLAILFLSLASLFLGKLIIAVSVVIILVILGVVGPSDRFLFLFFFFNRGTI